MENAYIQSGTSLNDSGGCTAPSIDRSDVYCGGSESDTRENINVSDLPSVSISGLRSSRSTAGGEARDSETDAPGCAQQEGINSSDAGESRFSDSAVMSKAVPAPSRSDGFTPDQEAEILRMRDRAMQLHRGRDPIKNGDTSSKFDFNQIGNRTHDFPQSTPEGEQSYRFEGSEVEMAIEAARKSGRPLVVDLGFHGCPYCDRMDVSAWPGVEKDLRKHAILLKIDVEKDPDAVRRFPSSGYPTVLVYDAGGNDLKLIKRGGFMTRERLQSFLQDAFSRYQRN